MPQCPISPLVTETNLTLCPAAAHLAAHPAAFSSQSSGCAPNAITRSLPSLGVSAACGRQNAGACGCAAGCGGCATTSGRNADQRMTKSSAASTPAANQTAFDGMV